jgi:hypothetical protein
MTYDDLREKVDYVEQFFECCLTCKYSSEYFSGSLRCSKYDLNVRELRVCDEYVVKDVLVI